MEKRSSVEESQLFQRIHNDVVDSFDEELELELEDHEPGDPVLGSGGDDRRQGERARRFYLSGVVSVAVGAGEITGLAGVHGRHKMVIDTKVRDAAGKGGVIKRITQRVESAHLCRVSGVAGSPNDPRANAMGISSDISTHLPAAGEDESRRSHGWYNRGRGAGDGVLQRRGVRGIFQDGA